MLHRIPKTLAISITNLTSRYILKFQMFLNESAFACLLSQCKQSANDFMQYKVKQKTHQQAQKIVFSYKCFGQQYKDFVVLYIAFVFRPQLGFQLGFSRFYSKLSVVKYNVTVKFDTNCLELTPWTFTPFGFSPGLL